MFSCESSVLFGTLFQRFEHHREILVPLVLAVGSLLLWRLWRFTISPWLHPERPKELPYWIPVLGHTISLYRNGAALGEAGFRTVANTLEPFAIQVLGVKNYYLTNPSDINKAFRNTTTLLWDTHIDNHLVSLGLKRNDLEALNKNLISTAKFLATTDPEPIQELTTKNFVIWAFRRQLSGDKIDELAASFLQNIKQQMEWPNLHTRAKVTTHTGIRMNLRDLLDCTLSTSITKMIWGEHIFRIEPTFTRYCQANIDGLYRLVLHYPSWLSKDFASCYERMMTVLEQFKESPPAQRSDASWLMRTVVEALNDSGMEKRSNATILYSMHLAVIANVHATSYWLVNYIIFDPNLKRAIIEETSPAFKDGTYNVAHVFKNCPLLESAFREVLRLYLTGYSARHITSRTVIGDKVFQPGNNILFPLRILNHLEPVWGNNHHEFDATRFLKDKSLANHAVFRPFGGGNKLCPGKAYAQRMVLSYVAYLLHVLDIEVPTIEGKKQMVPPLQDNTLIFGVSVPKQGMDPIVELKLSENAPIETIDGSGVPVEL